MAAESIKSLTAPGWPTAVLLAGNAVLLLLSVAAHLWRLGLITSPKAANFRDLTASDRYVEIATDIFSSLSSR